MNRFNVVGGAANCPSLETLFFLSVLTENHEENHTARRSSANLLA